MSDSTAIKVFGLFHGTIIWVLDRGTNVSTCP
jgi:hypothetical protein